MGALYHMAIELCAVVGQKDLLAARGRKRFSWCQGRCGISIYETGVGVFSCKADKAALMCSMQCFGVFIFA